MFAVVPALLPMFVAVVMFGFVMGAAGIMMAFLPFITAFFLLAYLVGMSAVGGYLGCTYGLRYTEQTVIARAHCTFTANDRIPFRVIHGNTH